MLSAWLVLLSGCALLQERQEHLSHQLERELRASQIRTEQLRAELARCGDQPQPQLDALYTDLLQIFRGSEVAVVRQPSGVVDVVIPGDLLFAHATVRVREEAAMPLDMLSVALGVHSSAQAQIIGHTDSVPLSGRLKATHTDNWGLSVARAAAVMRRLVEAYGVAPGRLTIAGRGEHEPVADNATAEGQAENRRVVVRLSAP